MGKNVLNMFTKRDKVKGLDAEVRYHAIYRVEYRLIERIGADIEIRFRRNPLRMVLVLDSINILTCVWVIGTNILQTEVCAKSGFGKILPAIVIRNRKGLELMFIIGNEHGEPTSYVVFGAQHVNESSTEAVSGVDARNIEVERSVY